MKTYAQSIQKFGNKHEIILGDSRYECFIEPMQLMNEWKTTTEKNRLNFQRNHFVASLCALKNFIVTQTCAKRHTHLHQSKYTYHILCGTDIRLIYFKLICGEFKAMRHDHRKWHTQWFDLFFIRVVVAIYLGA